MITNALQEGFPPREYTSPTILIKYLKIMLETLAKEYITNQDKRQLLTK
jgi:hypothetical protein